jgi:DNA-binding XRE family transcriptional regulator
MIDKITPNNLRELLAKAGVTQARAAHLCHSSTRSIEQWIAGDRAMPRSATAMLIWSLYFLGKATMEDVRPWLREDVFKACFDGA